MRTYRASWRGPCPSTSHAVVSMQWSGIKNGALLQLIEREGFNVSLTGDKNMENQQRLEKGRPFAVVIMSAINWPVVRPHIHTISVALAEARAGTVPETEQSMASRRV